MLKGASLSINDVVKIKERKDTCEVKILSLGKKDALLWYVY